MNRSRVLLTTAALVVLVSGCNERGSADRAPAAADTAVSAPAAAPAAAPVTFAPVPALDAASAPRIRCAVDSVNGEKARGAAIAVDAGGSLRFKGWVADTARRAPARFSILLAGPQSYAAAGTTGVRRADVARARKAKGLANAGFEVDAMLGPVSPGEYEVALTVDAGDTKARCATTTTIVVGAAG